MTFEVIIPTCNRADVLIKLVSQINSCAIVPSRIIIVDSSDEIDARLKRIEGVTYIRSSHKNKEYQLYLGCQMAGSDVVVFFDDDLEILDLNIFSYILDAFTNNDVYAVGVGLMFSGDKFSSENEKGNLRIKKSLRTTIKNIAVGKRVEAGKVWLLGMDTRDNNEDIEYIEYIRGGEAPSFRREIVNSLFDNFLLSLYELKIGKGEDKFLSMGALQYGKIKYISKKCLFHPSIVESHFYKNVISYRKKSMLARILLSWRYANLFNTNKVFIYIHFVWFSFWTSIHDALVIFSNPTKKNFNVLLGNSYGSIYAIYIMLQKRRISRICNWKHEVKLDIARNK